MTAGVTRISTGRTGGAPFVAFDGTNYLMVWADEATFPNKPLFGQFITKAGVALGSPFQIDPGPLGSSEIGGIAYGGGSYLVVYYKGAPSDPNEPNPDGFDKVYGRVISPLGVVGNEIVISTKYGDKGFNNLAFDGTNFLVVWTDDGNDYEVKGQFVNPTGTLGTEFSINASTAPSDNGESLAFDGTNYLVVWSDEVGGFGSGEWDLFGQLVDKSGNLVGNAISIKIAAGHQDFPSIAFDGTNYLVTWINLQDANNNFLCDSNEGTCWDVYGQYISKTGTPVGSEFSINTDAGNQFVGSPVFAGGKYLVSVNTGLTVDPPGCTEGCGIAGGDVIGLFITPTDTSNTGTVTGTVTYAGSLGPVNASKPILVMLDPFPNEFGNLAINGTFEQIATLTTSPGTFTFTNVPAGQYHLVVLLDVNNDGVTDDVNNGNPVRTDGDPVEVYTPGNETGSNCNTDPATAFTVTAGQTYSLSPSITFNDTMWAGGPGVTLSGQPCQ